MEKPVKKIKKKDIIRNGNSIPPTVINGKKVSLRNTCPFDSITEIFASAYLNFKTFRNYLEKEVKGNCYFSIVKYYAHHGANANFYKQRIDLIKKFYPQSFSGTIECADVVADLLKNLTNKFEYQISKEKTICKNCNLCQEKNLALISISAKGVWANGFSALEESVLEELFTAR